MVWGGRGAQDDQLFGRVVGEFRVVEDRGFGVRAEEVVEGGGRDGRDFELGGRGRVGAEVVKHLVEDCVRGGGSEG